MADEAFALSPISARATLPSEADYDAIRDAFMETSRGRWFLNEYAKRNRNADTSMVLDAVARIEKSLEAQKPAPVDDVAEVLRPLAELIAQSKARVAAELTQVDVNAAVVEARKATRVVRGVAWTLRECDADPRICDLLDAQVDAIDAGHHFIGATDWRDAVAAMFDPLIEQIGQLTGTPVAPSAEAASHGTSAELKVPEPASPTEMAEVPAQAATQNTASETSAATEVRPAEMVDAVATSPEAGRLDTGPEAMSQFEEHQPIDADFKSSIPVESEPEAPGADTEVVHAEDLALLDAIALEMGAPDFDDADMDDFDVEVPVSALMDAPARSEPKQGSVYVPPQPAAPPMQPSLGAALLANGIIPNPKISVNDALAPIRRMSQAEKIAFFS